MKLAIIAATGRIGQHLLDLALDAGHEVTAVARRPELVHRDVEVVQADLLHPDPSSLEKAVSEKDAVLSCLGPRTLREVGIASRGTKPILDAMIETGSSRIVVVSAALVGTLPTPARPNPPKHDPGDGSFMRYVMAPLGRTLLRKQQTDVAMMESDIILSGLDWTIVRPPRLTNKPPTHAYRTAYGRNLKRGVTISRADVAHYMLHALDDPSSVYQTVGIAN